MVSFIHLTTDLCAHLRGSRQETEGRGPTLWEPDAGAEKAEAPKGTRNDLVSVWGHRAGRAGTEVQEGAPVRTGGGGAGQAQGGQIREQGLGGANTPGWLEVGTRRAEVPGGMTGQDWGQRTPL